MDGECFDGMALVETSTNHNHEEILESVDSYAVRYLLRRLPGGPGGQRHVG